MPPSRIPPLLQPYTQLPKQDSLVLLTSVLGASTNWLVIRFLCGALEEAQGNGARRGYSGGEGEGLDGGDGEEDGKTAVVLVSWMRDWEFWRAEGRKAGGLDLARLVQQKRFVFVDGLTHLFMPPLETSSSSSSSAIPQQQAPSQQIQSLPSPLPLRTTRAITPRAPIAPSRQPAVGVLAPAVSKTAAAAPSQPHFKLTSPSLRHTEDVIQRAIAHVKEPSSGDTTPKKVLLVLDNPDLLLAAAGSLTSPSVSASPTLQSPNAQLDATALRATLLHLRQHVHATVVALAADAPLVAPSSVPLPLETGHAALVVGVAHTAARMMSLRLLDTGFAADVSGVVRITRGGGDEDEGEEGGVGEEKELLYYVGGDGSVKVFERGGGAGVG